MTAADRILIRKAECAAILDLLRPRVMGDTARIVEARLAALSDALMEAQAADLKAVLGAPAIRTLQPSGDPIVARLARIQEKLDELRQVPAAESPAPTTAAEPGCCGAYTFDLGSGCDRAPEDCPHQRPSEPPPAPAEAAPEPIPSPGVTSDPDQRVAPSAPAPESGHPSTAASTDPAEPMIVWSGERIALLRTLFPQPGFSLDDILARLNALPGPAISSTKAVKVRASTHGLRRPTPTPAAFGGGATVWSPERIALLREIYGKPDLSRHDILARINALPGPPCSSLPALKVKAMALGLRRTAAVTPPAPPTPAPARATPPVPVARPAAPPAAPPAPPVPAAAIDAGLAAAERHRRALAMLREGYSEQQIATRTGMPLAEVTAMVSAAEAEARNMLMARLPTDVIIDQTGLPPGTIRALRQEMARANA